MKNLKCKLNNQTGETLIEVIASILVCVISISMLMGGVAASATINKNADAVDETFYETLSQAETKQIPLSFPDTKVLIKESLNKTEVAIQLYGGEGMYSYGISE